MSKIYYVMSYRPVMPYLVLLRECVVRDDMLEEWMVGIKNIAENTGRGFIILENLPTVYLKERQVGNHAVYEFVDNNVSGEAWLK